MQLINNFFHNLMARIADVREEAGQTLVEYGLIVALLSIAAIVILGVLGQDIVDVFTEVSDELQNAGTP